MALQMGDKIYIPFDIPATELAAGTSIELSAPEAGVIEELITMVQTAIVTGGVVTAKIGTTDITGLTITVADAATKGTVQSDAPTLPSSTRYVAKHGRMQIVPSAAFNGGGALSGWLVLSTGKNA